MIPSRLMTAFKIHGGAVLLAVLAGAASVQAQGRADTAPRSAAATQSSSTAAPTSPPLPVADAAEGRAPQVLRSSGGTGTTGRAAVVSSSDALARAPLDPGGAEPTDPVGADSEAVGNPAASGMEFDEGEDTDASALTDFRASLDPHGRWIEHPRFGTVWVPHAQVVGTRFAPYVTRGRWALTDDDQWIWESDYPFGWVTFHYGRWAWADVDGWVWIPGRQYAPAWVNFRVGRSSHVGWAPMAPRYIWRRGTVVWLNAVPPSPYVFVPVDYAFYPSLQSYVIFQHYRVRPLMLRSRAYFPRGVRRHHHYHYYSPSLRYVPARARPHGRVRGHPDALRFRRPLSRAPHQTGVAPRPRRTLARPTQRAPGAAGASSRPSRSLNSARVAASPSPATRPSKELRSGSSSRSKADSGRRRGRDGKNKPAQASPPSASAHTSPKASPKRRSASRPSRPTHSGAGRSASGRVKATPRKAR